MKAMNLRFQLVVPLIREALRLTGSGQVVDLCSGAGGPMPVLLQALATEGITPNVTLTDRFPNLPSFQQAVEGSKGQVSFHPEPEDARAVPYGFAWVPNHVQRVPPLLTERRTQRAARRRARSGADRDF
jgi:hypothetical protein